MNKQEDNFIPLVAAFASVFGFGALVFIAYNMISTLADAREGHQKYVQTMQDYKNKYCKHVGFYGKYGEYKTYDCNGKIMKESDFK